ncbi:HSP20-like chaperone [Aspergillus uvarum CBS 121591]|uniref:HSP20-like chaperone n=1 Tax=Aspergillus uvarum CBS 121591 TaxID=1448315 RepID=A0A319CQE2_9EURO|nr:HSP20-like chaperone [Aspergillus uvarum CBS 121591]PYH86361.1 HSP20-like chaperone [Aspergillus uvarum CBS 121591]
MAIRSLNPNFPAWGFAANAEEPGSTHPWALQHSHPYPSPWAAPDGDGDETHEASGPRKPYPYPGPAKGHPPYTFPGALEGRKPYPFPGYAQQPHPYPGPLPWHQPHSYPGPAEGRNPYPWPWGDDGEKPKPKPKPFPRKPYPYPGPAEGHKPYPYPGPIPWRQPYPSPWGDDDDNNDDDDDNKCQPGFPRQPYRFPGVQPHKAGGFPYPQPPDTFPGLQQGGPSRRGWGANGSSARGGFDAPHHPWTFPYPNQPPYKFPGVRSNKYQPDVDVFDTPEAFVIHVPLPGAKKEDIEVSWDPKAVQLGISGTISRPGSEELLKTIALDERRVGAFERQVRLGSPSSAPKVEGEAISAKLEDGVLVVELPKTEPDDVEVKKVVIE